MATIMIHPIQTKSVDGNPVTISGICPQDVDCFVGEITAVGGTKQTTAWDFFGRMRDGSEGGGLNMKTAEMGELQGLVRHLGYKHCL